MRRSTPLPELLAPAGSEEALYAAVSAGADAVYLGARYSARAFAKNFDTAALADAVGYAHLSGTRVYLALNTLLYDRELPSLLPYVDELLSTGVDAAIVADLGLLSLLHRHFPSVPLHASTQAFIHNTATADFLAERGALRVVAARELSLNALSTLTEEAKPEVEVFLHGALCVCHSGQCLFSSLVGGRSGNRGECAQPCRLPYGGGYPLSLADLSLAAHIPALIDSGVSSLKIEGRMKSPSYVAGVTKIYRRLLDERRAAREDEQAALAELFSRSGFTDGYFVGNHRAPMTGIRTAEDKEKSRACQESFTKTPVSARAVAEIEAGKPARLTLSAGGRTAVAVGEVPTAAKTAPLTEGEVYARLSRLGGTGLSLARENLTLSLGSNLFLTAAQLNDLRRRAAAALLSAAVPKRGAVYSQAPLPEPPARPHRAVLAFTEEQARSVEERGGADLLYLRLTEAARGGYYPEGVALPPVVTDAEWGEVDGMLLAAARGGARYAMCESVGQLAHARAAGLIPTGGFRLNVTNRETVFALISYGVFDLCLSPELTARQVADLAGRVITYGRIPLMLTERCFIREVGGCERCGRTVLRDRRGVSFPLVREFSHRNLVLNSLPTYLADRPALLAEAGHPRELFLFTVESAAECRTVLDAADAHAPLPRPVRRLPQT